MIFTGYQWSDIEDCVNWMAVYACVIDCQDRVELKVFSRIASEDAHNIQTHTVSLDLLVSMQYFSGVFQLKNESTQDSLKIVLEQM